MNIIKSELSVDILQQPNKEITERELIDEAFFANNEYVIHESGIYKLKSGKDKSYFWQKLTDFYIRPVALLNTVDINLDLKEELTDANKEINAFHVSIEFVNIRNEKRRLNIPHDLFTDLSRSKLIKTGYELPPDLNIRREIQKAINAALRQGQSSYVRTDGVRVEPCVEFSEAYTARGWVNDTTHIRESHPRFVGSTLKLRTDRRGEASIQYDVFKQLIKSSRLFALFTSVAFAGYTKDRIRKTANFSPIWNIYGKAQAGKSTLCLMIASIEGSPTKAAGLIKDSTSTWVGLESFLAGYTNGFFIIDEIDEFFRDKTAVSRLLAMANNGGRSKFDQDTEATEGKSWNLNIISNSNDKLENLIKGDQKEEAATTRVFEFDVQDKELNIFGDHHDSEGKNIITDLQVKLLGNYGHLYQDIIDYIIANADKLDKDILIYEEELKRNPHYLRLKDDKRTVQCIALEMIGADIVGGVLGDEYGKLCHEAIAIHKSRFSNIDEPDYNEDDIHWDRMEMLKDFINANKGSFVWETYAYEEKDGDISDNNYLKQQKAKAKFFSTNADMKGNVLGFIKLDRMMEHAKDFEGSVILTAAGEAHLQRTFKVYISDLKAAANFLGLLDDGRKVHPVKQKKIGLETTRGTFFKLTHRPLVLTDNEQNVESLLDGNVVSQFSKDDATTVENIMRYAHSSVDNIIDDEENRLDFNEDFVPF